MSGLARELDRRLAASDADAVDGAPADQRHAELWEARALVVLTGAEREQVDPGSEWTECVPERGLYRIASPARITAVSPRCHETPLPAST